MSVLTVGYDTKATVGNDNVELEIKYSHSDNSCCCGECTHNPSSYEGETYLDMSKQDVLSILAAMGVTSEEMKEYIAQEVVKA